MISVEHRERVAIVKLNRGVTNAINLQLVGELVEALQEAKQDPDVSSLVLTGSEKFFSIGFDIPHLYGLAREDFRVYYRAFNRLCLDLYTLPKPTVAAITGHAIAGGCILALCCDQRFIAEGRKLMGLNEIKLGVPVPYPGDRILRDLVGARNAREIVEAGDFYPSEELLRMGVVDRVMQLEQVLPESIEKAASLGALPQEPFAVIKGNRVEAVAAQVLAQLEEKESVFLEQWYSGQTRELLKAAMERF